MAKEKVAAQMDLKEGQASTSGVDSVLNGNESSSTLSKQNHWKVGDYVRSVYSEDGIIYEAVIKKINQSELSCLLKYLGTMCC